MQKAGQICSAWTDFKVISAAGTVSNFDLSCLSGVRNIRQYTLSAARRFGIFALVWRMCTMLFILVLVFHS